MFFSYFPTVQPFSHLQSISFIYKIDDEQTLIRILDACRQLLYLTQLKLRYLIKEEIRSSKILDAVWSLPKLSHFYLYFTGKNRMCDFSVQTVISLSLEHVSIENGCSRSLHLSSLIKKTPRLRRPFVA
jgi:hypothetical protein